MRPAAVAAGLLLLFSGAAMAESTPESGAAGTPSASAPAGERRALFGDLHVHTRYSFDAYIFNARATPEDAYRFAKGEPITHPLGYPMRLRGGPLDFYAVTDHATYLGVLDAFGDPAHPLSKTPLAGELNSSDMTASIEAFRRVANTLMTGEEIPGAAHPDVRRQAWRRIADAAQAHNDPGRFTTFVGYEYTSNPPYNLHRNVIFRGAEVPELPFAATDSLNPEDLWRWLDEQRARGIEALAIPHNANWSNGTMFADATYAGDPLDSAWAELRMRNEPIVEITQIKGTSDTHPLLSPNDEWADFEIFADSPGGYAAVGDLEPESISVRGSYVRDALLRGLVMQERAGFNPYRFGFIGSSDTHNAGAGYEEESYVSKVGIQDGEPVRRGSIPSEGMSWDEYASLPPDSKPPPYYADWSASGLTGVWVAANTREAIYAAFRRKETFGTSGPRIRVRAWAGKGLDDLDLAGLGAAGRLYDRAVPMGGELTASGAPVEIFAEASRDPRSAWLQRLQVVKGWVEDGESREKVFDAACSDGLRVDPETRRCPDNGARVDLNTCVEDFERGAAELSAHWIDSEFDPSQRAFYYVRVLENPTCRWSTWDALRAGVEPMPGKEPVIQDRAWTSPIWYDPAP